MGKGIVHLLRQARRGQLLEVRATTLHPMETGQRLDSLGRPLARDIVRRIECRWGNDLVFAADLFPAVAANPYVSFFVVANTSAVVTVRWRGDNGFEHQEAVSVEVL